MVTGHIILLRWLLSRAGICNLQCMFVCMSEDRGLERAFQAGEGGLSGVVWKKFGEDMDFWSALSTGKLFVDSVREQKKGSQPPGRQPGPPR